jgi:type I restriction enzyme S subunit
VNAQRLLQHFVRISEASNAVPRLRRFILDLAVRRRLVEQDPSDESVLGRLKKPTANELESILSEQGEVRIRNEMCNHEYRFDREAVDTLFR